MNAPGRRWLSPREVAERLGLHVQSVYAMINRGTLPTGRVGGRALRLDWPEIERQLEAQAAAGKGGSK